jgi:hypothetical protein
MLIVSSIGSAVGSCVPVSDSFGVVDVLSVSGDAGVVLGVVFVVLPQPEKSIQIITAARKRENMRFFIFLFSFVIYFLG